MPKLVFLGTKGKIEESSRNHQYHSSLLLASRKFKLLIDYGLVHQYTLEEIKPDTVLITHAHPDHYIWLEKEVKTEIPVYLTRETFDYGQFKPGNYKIIQPNKKIKTGPFEILPYRVLHSIRCPAVGLKIKTPEDKTFAYNPDVVDIVGKDRILEGIDWYIGDGSSIKMSLVRRKGDKIFGHTRITTQINWCKKYSIKTIIFTHVGKETMEKEEEFKKEYPEVLLAYDGMELKFSKEKNHQASI